MMPTFIGIGAPKAGTTWLARCLDDHPDVYVAPVKETSFFDYGSIDGRLGEYEAHFAGVKGEHAVGELSTRYLASTRAPERIKTHVPHARLFVSLRNPIDQVYSHYWHLARQNFHQWSAGAAPGTFEEALDRYPDRLIQPALYYQHLQRWYATFERSQMYVLLYDDILREPLAAVQRLYEFIEVNPSFCPPSLHETGSGVRRGVSPRAPAFAALHRHLYSYLNRTVYHPLKQAVGVRRADRLKETLRVRTVMERVFFREGYPAMSLQTRARLTEIFKDELSGLETLTGASLSQWR